jgi:hypothetical protein
MGVLLLVALVVAASARQEGGKWDILGDAPRGESVGLYLSLRHEPAKLAAFNTKVRRRALANETLFFSPFCLLTAASRSLSPSPTPSPRTTGSG